ncbi:hypothetical protein [Streptomyces sp. NBC_00191]|uniref:hypothetical protein n=1 Tax=Streptomyces sp. NBC_00191 TaxID=2975674 RepID=UPI003870B02B
MARTVAVRTPPLNRRDASSGPDRGAGLVARLTAGLVGVLRVPLSASLLTPLRARMLSLGVD